MNVLNWKDINEDDLYKCYSMPLKKFLTKIKFCRYIGTGKSLKTNKIFFVFIKSKRLQEYLDEWKANKENGTLAFPKK